MAANDPGHDLVPPKPVRPSWETAAPPEPRPTPAARPPAAPAAPPWSAVPRPPVSPPPSQFASPAPFEGGAAAYDLAGNPIAGAAASPTPHAPPTQFGYSAGPAAASWPPPPVGGPAGGGLYGLGEARNNSGEQSHLPPEIGRLRWHWGAFFFPILWTKKHGLTTVAAMLAGGLFALRMLRVVLQSVSPVAFVAICGVYAVTYLALQVYFGLNGHRIGWRNRHFPGGTTEYFKVQNAWMWWGFGLGIISPVLIVMAFLGVLGAALAGGGSGSSSGNGTYGSHRYGSHGYGGSYGGSGYSRPYSTPPATSNAGDTAP